MNRGVKITITCFTIWVLTALLNAVLFTCCLRIFSPDRTELIAMFVISTVLTLVCSTPSVFVFWLVYLSSAKNDGSSLFRLLLRAGFILALMPATLFLFCFPDILDGKGTFLFCSILIATIMSVMLHHRFIIQGFTISN